MITDWNAAYSNMDHVPDGPSYPPLWMAAARDYREAMSACGRARLNLAYGPGERHRLDMFLPQGQSAGLVVFVHGGYWRAFDKDVFSHLASGCVDMGHTVALPSYTLCPQARIHEITREIAMAVTMLAGEADGPVTLAGHSAGGHLVARMACTDSAVAGALAGRQVRVVSISGVHDLRPLLMTDMNEILRLDAREARAESVCLLEPLEGTQVTCWVGAEELPEFVRQNDLLANVWAGLGRARARCTRRDITISASSPTCRTRGRRSLPN